MLIVKKDCWLYRIANSRTGKFIPTAWNFYRTRTGALAGIRAIRRQPGGERNVHKYVR